MPIVLPGGGRCGPGLEGKASLSGSKTAGAASSVSYGSKIALYATRYSKRGEVFRTTDEAHPGVARLYSEPRVLLGGDVWLLTDEQGEGRGVLSVSSDVDGLGDDAGFRDATGRLSTDYVWLDRYRLSPAETRAEFRRRGWANDCRLSNA